MKKTLYFLLAFLGTLASFSALSYEKNDLLLRAGIALMEPKEKSDSLFLTAPAIAVNNQPLDTLVGAKTGLGIDNKLAVAGSLSYVLNDNWGIETLIGLPVELNVTALGLSALGLDSVADVAKAQIFPLTLSFQYYPTMHNSPFQPYAGIGVNYAYIANVDLDDSVEPAFGSPKIDFGFDDSFGYSLNAGVDWKINDTWFANVSIYYLSLETDAEADIAQSATLGGADATLETSIEANTFVYFLTAGYKF